MRTRPEIWMSWFDPVDEPVSNVQLDRVIAEWAVVQAGGVAAEVLLAGGRAQGLRARIRTWMQGLGDPGLASGLIGERIRAECHQLLDRASRRGIAGEVLDLLVACLIALPAGSAYEGDSPVTFPGGLQTVAGRLMRLVEWHLDAADLRFLGFWAPLERLAALTAVLACVHDANPTSA